ncbi:methyltransferase [Kitasatospora aureofaciens]|uniref:methyltransferase n=1 Tax=Kitasatospora aureofaciens TaxID=1894 RepID=UPI001C45B790|nr:methyltransferase [Kitasatospora aureofaciens]MBV6695858.1 methyltransferase domain-containing protein [Kitasatospora aureofaciens]
MTPTTDSAAARARRIVALNTAYFQAKALQSAVELGLFELLADRSADVGQIRAELGVQHRLFKDFLDALTGLGLLDEQDGRYQAAPLAREFLLPGSPTYLGGTARQHARLHYHAWAQLTDALRDGKAKSAVAAQGQLAYPTQYEDLDRARQIMLHMDAHNGFTADELARAIDWSQYTSFVDVGGGRGNVASRIAAAHPHLRGAVFDLPALRPLFDELVAEAGTADRVAFHGGDFFATDLPEADVVIFGHVLPDWPVADRRELLRRAHKAVRPGGLVVLYDAMIDPDERDPEVLLQRINHTMIRDEAGAYSLQQARDYLVEAGFTVDRIAASDTITRDHFAIGVKSA